MYIPVGSPIRHNWLRVAALSVAMTIAIIAALELVRGRDLSWPVLLVVATAVFVLAKPFIMVYEALVPTRFFADHIQGYTLMSTQIRIHWRDITKVTFPKLPIFRYAVLHAPAGKLWFPMDIENPDDVYRDLVSIVGDEHIFVRALASKGWQA